MNFYRIFALLASFLLACKAYTDWDYQFLGKPNDAQIVNEASYQRLKSSVIDYLQNSWCSKEKATLIMDLVLLEKPSVCVEIGVFTGSSLLPIAATLSYLKNGKVYAIDPWSNEEATLNYPKDDPNTLWWKELNMSSIYSMCIKTVQQWKLKPYCALLKQPSREAVTQINNIDFLHIDGNYSEESSLEDVRLFLPKVNKGGHILYSCFGWSMDGKQTRVKAFQELLDSCIIIAILDERNTFLLKKL